MSDLFRNPEDRFSHNEALLVIVCRCPQWTDDEQICCRNVNNELHFFENSNFGKVLTCINLYLQILIQILIYYFTFTVKIKKNFKSTDSSVGRASDS